MSEKKNVILAIPGPRQTELREKPYPKIKPGYTMVKTTIAPICIEHQIYKESRYEWHGGPEQLGHEGVGIVCEVAAGSRFKVGDRVTVYQGHSCDDEDCYVCRRGLGTTHCMGIPYEEMHGGANPLEPLASIGGATAMDCPGGINIIQKECESESGAYSLSQYRIAPDRMIQKLPEDLSFRYAAAGHCFLGCTYSPQAELNIKKDDFVLVTGVGFIGMGAIINAKYRGAKVIVLGRSPYRMELAKKLGADYIINPEDPDWLDQIKEITGYLRGVDYAFECSGYEFYQRKCLQAVRRYGWMWVLGFLVDEEEQSNIKINLLEEVHNRAVKISGSHDVRYMDREGLVNMLKDPYVQEAIDIGVTHEYNMSDATMAFEQILTKKAGKVYLYPHEDCPDEYNSALK